jgi:hypothetical protein
MLEWKTERERLLASFRPDGIYRRAGSPNSGLGDTLTDVGALGLLVPKYAIRHLQACQDAQGRLYRHPSRLGVPGEAGDFSRDHILSICFASIYSGYPDVARKFLQFVLMNFGRFCEGPIGQSLINIGALAALLIACDRILYRPIAAILYLFHIIILYITVRQVEVGYRITLHVEHCLLARKAGLPWFLLRPIIRKALEREPGNLFYEWAHHTAQGQALPPLAKKRLLIKWTTWKKPGGTHWHWTEPTNPKRRAPTGVDLCYLLCLSGCFRDLNGSKIYR